MNLKTAECDFTTHANILYSIIQNQAGTLAKAFLEAIMNAIDANSSKVSIELSETGFTISDVGRGFQSKDEVLNWFGKFGTPHEEGDATYGKYRMGRGQLMAFAKTSWRTGTFQMDVDIKQNGLKYNLTENLPNKKGCVITGVLYKQLSSFDIDDVLTELRDLTQFAQIPVKVNGKAFSRPLSSIKWDIETPYAYVKLTKTDELFVYNLGVLVRTYGTHQFGSGGIVVSKLPLKVNFARNDILLSECQVWERICQSLRQTSIDKCASKSVLTEDERRFLSRQWYYGKISKDKFPNIERLKLFTDAEGKHHSLESLKNYTTFTTAKESQLRVGARLHRDGKAFVLNEDTLGRFHASSMEELLRILYADESMPSNFNFMKFEDVALGCDDTYQVLGLNDLSDDERFAFMAISESHQKFFKWFSSGEVHSGLRELKPGKSNVALGWTDGKTYIVIGKEALARAIKKKEAGFFELLMLLLHEYCHDTADLESHAHDMTFYTKFHDIVQYRGGQLVKLALDMHRKFVKSSSKFKSVSAIENLDGLVPLEVSEFKPAAKLVNENITAIAACESQISLF